MRLRSGVLIGPGKLTLRFLFHDVMPLTLQEARRLTANGAPRVVVAQIRLRSKVRAVLVIILMLLTYSLPFVLVLQFPQPSDLGDALSSNEPGLTIGAWSIVIFGVFYVWVLIQVLQMSFGRSWARDRLLISTMQAVRTIQAWDCDYSDWPRNWLYIDYSVSFLREQMVTRRRMRRLAWAISRDIAIFRGLSRGAAADDNTAVGRALLWMSDFPWHGKRRAIAWQALADLVNYVASPRQGLPASLTAEGREFDVTPTGRERTSAVLAFLRVPLVTGLVLALVAALLRVVF
jgi:hypothetical protein